MKAIADVCIVPIGVGVSVSEYVVVCEKTFREAGLDPRLHAYGTNVEGEWDEVMDAVRRCHECARARPSRLKSPTPPGTPYQQILFA
jgi:uncharacterized protein (TIGR00106 family)